MSIPLLEVHCNCVFETIPRHGGQFKPGVKDKAGSGVSVETWQPCILFLNPCPKFTSWCS